MLIAVGGAEATIPYGHPAPLGHGRDGGPGSRAPYGVGYFASLWTT
ncbi:hypothetical protein ACFOY2_00240 [Nonomuraea purpurea]|uniref:Uncharacterized protein n=1 Tax=Nonomuraea purpurea TaxID=1849276 RepID=A0ABV8FV97_9ACTN